MDCYTRQAKRSVLDCCFDQRERFSVGQERPKTVSKIRCRGMLRCHSSMIRSHPRNHAGTTLGRASTPDLLPNACLDQPDARERDSDDVMKWISHQNEVRHSKLPDCNSEGCAKDQCTWQRLVCFYSKAGRSPGQGGQATASPTVE